MTREQLAQVALNANRNALLNPNARNITTKPLTLETYMEARMITSPFCLYDCDRFTDCSTVVIVSAGEAIDEVNWRAGPIRVSPLGIRSDQSIEIARLELVRVVGEHFDVADAVIARARREHAGVKRQRRQSGVAARAAAADDEPRLVGESRRHEMPRRVHHVLDVSDAPFTAQRVSVLTAET